MGKNPTKWDFRDVSTGLQTIREFLLGRKFLYHQRFMPFLAPRSIPKPDIPRGPDYKYADQWYGDRDVLNSVKPPVVAPIAEGAKGKGGSRVCTPTKRGGTGLKFPSVLPTPGCVWWFDAHCYYKEVYQTPCGPTPTVPSGPCTPPSPAKAHSTHSPCAKKAPKDPCAEKPPCKLEPFKVEKEEPPKKPEICDPCLDDKKKD